MPVDCDERHSCGVQDVCATARMGNLPTLSEARRAAAVRARKKATPRKSPRSVAQRRWARDGCQRPQITTASDHQNEFAQAPPGLTAQSCASYGNAASPAHVSDGNASATSLRSLAAEQVPLQAVSQEIRQLLEKEFWRPLKGESQQKLKEKYSLIPIS